MGLSADRWERDGVSLARAAGMLGTDMACEAIVAAWPGGALVKIVFIRSYEPQVHLLYVAAGWQMAFVVAWLER